MSASVAPTRRSARIMAKQASVTNQPPTRSILTAPENDKGDAELKANTPDESSSSSSSSQRRRRTSTKRKSPSSSSSSSSLSSSTSSSSSSSSEGAHPRGPLLDFPHRTHWREWLSENHATVERVRLLIYKKHTGKPFIRHRQQLEEALCWGWVDTTVKRIDEDTYLRCFVRRGKSARWSDNTLRYAREMIAAKQMAPAGLAAFERGLARFEREHGGEAAPGEKKVPASVDPNKVPAGLARAMDQAEGMRAKFDKLSNSSKKMFLKFYISAKREETKVNRAEKIVRYLREGKKNPYY